MKNIEWKAVVQRDGWSDRINLWLGQYSADGRFYNATIGKGGVLKLTEAKEGTLNPAPLMKIPGIAWQEIVNALYETAPPAKKEAVDAELKATIAHLEDLRMLLKLRPKVKKEIKFIEKGSKEAKKG